MEYKNFILKYAEIGIKGKNRYRFEDALMHQVKRVLKEVDGSFNVTREQGRIYANVLSDTYDYDATIEALGRVFGVTGICPIYQLKNNKDFNELKEATIDFVRKAYGDRVFTFKIHAKRGDKTYPLTSDEINAELGGVVLDNFPNTKVEVHKPDVIIRVEVRQHINIFSFEIPGPGGLPLGTNGKGMLLLSGGIDSPVAGYKMAKRGVIIDAVYFHAPPYTSERAKQKVIDLAKIVSKYSGPIKLHIINFTDIQLAIYEKCPHEELTIIMRRYMMRIAEALAIKNECLGLITGESVGQVASQTMASLVSTNEVCTLPVHRPLIAYDKQEIVDVAEKIGTFEISIQPYEDCCTIFVAKHPVTKPSVKIIKKSEKALEGTIEPMVDKAIETCEIIWCN